MSEETTPPAPFASPGAANAPDQAAFSQVLEREFLTLPESQREVLRLKFKHGWGYPQIAEATGQSVSTVGYLVHHGMRNLATRVEKG